MNRQASSLFIAIIVLVFAAAAQAQIFNDTLHSADSIDLSTRFPRLLPVTGLIGGDNPDDAGGALRIEWEVSADDLAEGGRVSKYVILSSESRDSGFFAVGSANRRSQAFIHRDIRDNIGRYYRVLTFPLSVEQRKLHRPEIDSLIKRYPDLAFLDEHDISALYYAGLPLENIFDSAYFGVSEVLGPVMSSAQWFNNGDLGTLIVGLTICLSVAIFIALAKRGRKLFLRRIRGLQAIDEAIGRATEMGRSILFIPGIQDMDDVQTVAGVTILGHVAKTIAEYDVKINMPVSRSIVMTTARETIKEAYLSAGRPEAYSDDMVHYLTDEQFGYVAAVDGIMVREKPATCFYLGAFFAESLIMAETGNSIGAIQIAGTAMPAQLPFFVAACDYTLIGEELFAASAYLSGEPKQLGSLKGQDVGKGIAMLFMLIGSIAATIAVLFNSASMSCFKSFLDSFFSAGDWDPQHFECISNFFKSIF